jgi:hypothetical protein
MFLDTQIIVDDTMLHYVFLKKLFWSSKFFFVDLVPIKS